MKDSAHTDLIFRLNPPKEVDDFRRRQFSGGSGGSLGDAASAKSKPVKAPSKQKDLLADLDDDDLFDNDSKGITLLDDDDDFSAAPVPEQAASSSAAAENSKLDEMVKYYYGSAVGMGYISGGGEKPNYIRIPATQVTEAVSGPFPRAAFRKFYQKNPATGYVISIVDCYGNETKTAVCPHCHTPVFTQAGLYETYVLPVIGVSQSGKSVLLAESFTPFMKKTARTMLPTGMFLQDTEMKQYIETISDDLKDSGEISATLGVQRLFSEMEGGNRKIAICTFDLPGEHIANEMYQEFREKELSNLLHRANGIIIIFCPEQVESITNYNLKTYKEDQADTASIKPLEDMIRLLVKDSDDAGVIKTKNIPIAILMTKLDLFRLGSGINAKIDTSKMDSDAKKMLGSVYDRDEVTTIPEQKDVVNLGEIDRYSAKTKEFFEELIHNEINMILTKFAGNKHNVNCFAISSQGADISASDFAPPIRPNEPFYWLFAKMGIYKQPIINPKQDKKRR